MATPTLEELMETYGFVACEASHSSDFLEAVDAGIVTADQDYYQLQKVDALGLFDNDSAAINKAIKLAIGGDSYAQAQLKLSMTDLLVRYELAYAALHGALPRVWEEIRPRGGDTPNLADAIEKLNKMEAQNIVALLW